MSFASIAHLEVHCARQAVTLAELIDRQRIKRRHRLTVRGEQAVLRAILEGRPLARCDWHSLRVCDFAHDLHGRIFRHAVGIMTEGITPWAYVVRCSTRSERGMHAMQGVRDYLEWLTSDDPCFATRRVEALVAFLDAPAEQWAAEARAEAASKAKRSRA